MAKMSIQTRDVLNNSSLPEFQAAQLGTSLFEALTGQLFTYTSGYGADFSDSTPFFTAPFPLRIVDVIVEAHATEANGAVKVIKGADEICTAIVCAVDGVAAHMAAGATSATQPDRLLAAGDAINVQAVGDTAANVRGRITVLAVRV